MNEDWFSYIYSFRAYEVKANNILVKREGKQTDGLLHTHIRKHTHTHTTTSRNAEVRGKTNLDYLRRM